MTPTSEIRNDTKSGFYNIVCEIQTQCRIYHSMSDYHFRISEVILSTNNNRECDYVDDADVCELSRFVPEEYEISEDMLTFKINMNALVECLNIFGGSSIPGVTPALKMCYQGYGSPLILLLEEAGVLTDCKIRTQEADETLDFNFSNSGVVNKVIMRSECLREIFSELDMSSDVLEILMSPDPPYFRFSTFGSFGVNHTDIPRDSDMIETFACTSTMSQRYKMCLLRPCVKALGAAQKVSVRTDDRGFLCLQFMIKTQDNHICFIEFFCCPDEEIEKS
ncbi:unnamed protein product, partial [Meganyctiphanes norvegica]